MIQTERPAWLRALRPTRRRLAALAALATTLCLYHSYFTPQQRVARARLSEADDRCEAAIDARLKPVADLFAKGRKGSGRFAEDALSWSGKWNLIVGAFDGTSHRAFLAEAFDRHIFSNQDVQVAVEAALCGFLTDIEGYEAEMLVRLRADLADPDGPALPRWGDDEAFRREYRTLLDAVAGEMQVELGVAVGREVGVLVATELVTRIAVQALRAAAAEMGVSATLLGSGAASTVATLGVGLVVGLIIDALLDEILKLAGHDPVAKVRRVVDEALKKMEAALLHPGGFFSTHKTGALRRQMEELHEARSKARREAIARLLKGGDR